VPLFFKTQIAYIASIGEFAGYPGNLAALQREGRSIESLVEIVATAEGNDCRLGFFRSDDTSSRGWSAESAMIIPILNALRTRHGCGPFLLAGALREEIGTAMDAAFAELRDLLRSVELLRDLTKRSLDQIMSFGERLSAMILTGVFESKGMPARCVDARDIIKTDDRFGSARYLKNESLPLIIASLANLDKIAVIPGFIGSTMDGVTTTMGRGGLDLTASILGACIGTGEIQIWSDVERYADR